MARRKSNYRGGDGSYCRVVYMTMENVVVAVGNKRKTALRKQIARFFLIVQSTIIGGELSERFVPGNM